MSGASKSNLSVRQLGLRPERQDMSTTKTVWLILSGLVPLLGFLGTPPDPMLLIYTAFVVVVLFLRRLESLMDHLPGTATLQLVGLFLISGSITETLAWLNNYWKAAPQPALFHPQLFADLLIGIGFHGGWAVAWLITFRWFRFTLLEVFLVTGFLGIGFEQLGAVFLIMVRTFVGNPVQSLLFGAYVFLVYGSAAGLAIGPLLHRFNASEKSTSWVRFPLVMALMVALAAAGCLLASAYALPFGGLPPKRSIVEHPFW
jgi:hypothetical protein